MIKGISIILFAFILISCHSTARFGIMKFKTTVSLIITIVFFSGVNIFAQKFYVSPSGNDSKPGTFEKPLETLVGARNRVREFRKQNQSVQSVEIIVKEGTYQMFQPLELNTDDSGSEIAPLVIKADQNAKVILRGGVPVSGFEKINERLWRTFIPNVAYYDYYFEQLYVNGKRTTRARTPNSGFYFVKNSAETIIEKGDAAIPKLAFQKIAIDSADAGFMDSFSTEDYNDAMIIFYHKWDNTRKHISGYDKQSHSVFTIGTGMQPWNALDNKSRYYVENFRAALDSPGEWFLDRAGYLYYIPENGQTIENTTFIVPVLKEFINIRGDQGSGKKVRNIRFENISFEVAAYHTPAGGNEAAQAASPVEAVITADYATEIEFRNCEVSHTGTYAFWFRRACNNCIVNHCYLHDLGAGGVKIGETVIRDNPADLTSFITVDNNIIRDCGHVFPCAVGIIIFNASDNKLTHNEIADLRYTGISAGWVWGYAFSPSKRNIIAFNHIHHLGWGELCDMGGVYTLGASEGTSVSNNVIHHVYSFDYGGWGLYTDEGSYGITEENNLVYACKNSGFHQHYGKENIIRNNIFALNIRAELQATRIEDHRSISFTNNIIYFDKGALLSSNWHKFNLLSDYNCYWDIRNTKVTFAGSSFAEWQKSGKDTHSVIADPLFANPSSFDFHFKNQKVAKKIKFIPFEYSNAGVYGSEEWKKLALFSHDLEIKFDKMVETSESSSK